MRIKIISLFVSVFLMAVAGSVHAAATEVDFSVPNELIRGSSGASLGQSGLAFIGDINADGYGDYAFSGVSGSGFVYTDIAYIVYGDANWETLDITNTAVASFSGVTGDGYGGPAIAGGGDINNDGYDDVLVGMSFENSRAGATYIIYGSATKYSGSNDITSLPRFTGEASGDYSGVSVAIVGDVNFDGYDDILIGSHWNDSKKGAAYLIYGQGSQYSGETSVSTLTKFTGLNADDRTGNTVSGAGDVNGDGFADFLINASSYNDYAGQTYLIYGQSTAYSGIISLAEADVVFTAEETYDGTGARLSKLGDINNDGYDDILIGIQEEGPGTIAHGCYLIYGGALSGSISLSSADMKFSSAYARSAEENNDADYNPFYLGDINLDGYNDVGISLYNYSASKGAVYVIFGEATKMSGSMDLAEADYLFTIAEDDYRFGWEASSGDVNGDHVNDLLVAATNYNVTGANAGAIYVGQLYTDADGDNVPGSGFLTGTDTDDTIKDIQSVTGAKNGKIKITYVNGDFVKLQIYNIEADRKTKVLQYSGGYYLVLHPRGKKIRLFNTDDLSTVSTLTLSKVAKYNKHNLQTADFRSDNILEIVVVSYRKGMTMVSLLQVDSITGKLVKKSSAHLVNVKIQPGKTTIKGNRIILKNKLGKKMVEFYVNKNYKLK